MFGKIIAFLTAISISLFGWILPIAPAPSVPEVIEIMNTDTSKGWVAGPYKFEYSSTRNAWVYSGPHAWGEFKIPSGYDIWAEGEILGKWELYARGGTSVERLYNGVELRKQ